MHQRLLSIQEVSIELKIPKHTLRYWEKEFDGILVPIRTEGGQRRYTFEHMKILEEIKQLKKEGKRIAEIRDKLQRNADIGMNRPGPGTIDLLAKRIAEVLKDEFFDYFRGQEDDIQPPEITKP